MKRGPKSNAEHKKLVGFKRENGKGQAYEVITHLGRERKGQNTFHTYEVRFADSGTIVKARKGCVIKGRVRDPGARLSNGGVAGPARQDGHIRNVWKGMMDRCYLPTAQNYKSYGAVGVTVCSEWHHLHNFRAFFIQMPNFGLRGHLDKDLLGCSKLYSPESCWLVPEAVNVKIRNRVAYCHNGNVYLSAAEAARGIGVATSTVRMQVNLARPNRLGVELITLHDSRLITELKWRYPEWEWPWP